MKTQRLLMALTVINLVLMVFVLAQTRAAKAKVAGPLPAEGTTVAAGGTMPTAPEETPGEKAAVAAQGAAPVLRGRALEIVDDRGKVRASITIYPADPNVKMPDGSTGYPETVLLRLINSKGRPNVKIEATEDGAGMGLGGESDPTYALLGTRGATPSLKLTGRDGRQQIIKP